MREETEPRQADEIGASETPAYRRHDTRAFPGDLKSVTAAGSRA